MDHFIDITTNLNERTITIYDSGIGMTREQIVENLGTIAKSGSDTFRNLVEDDMKSPDSSTADNIIGQFGVGFYSSFIVSDLVEVYSKAGADAPGVKWASEGFGDYEVSNISNLEFACFLSKKCTIRLLCETSTLTTTTS